MPDQQPPKPPAPYLPFKTFLNSLDVFDHGIPPKIDRTIWRQSGLTQGLIMGALRFFNLIDENDRPTEFLHRIVQHKDQRPTEIKILLTTHYSEIIKHDLTKITPKMLDDLIEVYGVSGGTKKKATTFFLQAAKFAEMPLSAFLQTQIRNTGPRKRRQPTVTGRRGVFIGEMDGAADENYAPAAASRTEISLKSGGRLVMTISADPFKLAADDRKFVFDLIDKLQGYEQQHSGPHQKAAKGTQE